MKKIIILLLCVTFQLVAQENSNSFLSRLRGIKKDNLTFYSIDGVNVISEKFDVEFNKSELKKLYIKHNIKESDSILTDKVLSYKNYIVEQKQYFLEKYTHRNKCYYLKNKEKKIITVCFVGVQQLAKELERKLINTILNEEIPANNYESKEVGVIDFVGRKLDLTNKCKWNYVNTIQCLYDGAEISWSIHKNFKSAVYDIQSQIDLVQSKDFVKQKSNELVAIEFLDKPTMARKIVFTFDRSKLGLPVAQEQKLNTYYITAKLDNNNYVSSVISFWNTANLGKSGLTPILEQIMSLNVKE